MHRTRILTAAITTLALAAPAAIATAPAAAAETKVISPACSSASKLVSSLTKKSQKAKTPKAKKAAKKKLAKAKKSLSTCTKKNPILKVKSTTIAADDMFQAEFSLPTPKVGTHYQLKFYGNVPENLEVDCAFVATKDYISPTGIGFLSAILDTRSPVFCQGSGSVDVQVVPDTAPENYTGDTIASVPVTVGPPTGN